MVTRLLNDDQKEHLMQVSQEVIECLLIEPGFLYICGNKSVISFARTGDQAPEQSVEVFDITEAEESKIVKIKSQNHTDQVLW